jgi:hypothetical protein
MRKGGLLILFSFFLSQGIFAQSLVGSWVSDQPLLSLVRFSLTFSSDMTYRIDCSLGQATGTYTYTDNTITFTPIKSGINAGSVGALQIFPYRFLNDSTLFLDEKGTEVKLTRVKTKNAVGLISFVNGFS